MLKQKTQEKKGRSDPPEGKCLMLLEQVGVIKEAIASSWGEGLGSSAHVKGLD